MLKQVIEHYKHNHFSQNSGNSNTSEAGLGNQWITGETVGAEELMEDF